MRRFEHDDAFWEVHLDGELLVTRTGRIGTDGRVASKRFATAEKAQKEADKRVLAHHEKGFTEVFAVAAEPTNDELERAIIEDPADAGRLLVYADWLQAQSHPRGELAVVQSQRGQADAAALAKAEDKLFDKYPALAPRRFFEMVRKPRKDVQEHSFCSARWENGFIASARVARSSTRPPYTVRELVAELLGHPAARFMRELRIGPLNPLGSTLQYADVVSELARARPAALRSLSLVDLPPGAPELDFADLGDLAPLSSGLPFLEELRLAGAKMELGAFDLPKLRSLTVASIDLKVLASVASSKCPALEALHLECGEAAIDLQALATVLGASWPSLKRLSLTRTSNTDLVVATLLEAGGLLGRLEVLDLSGGRLTIAGAARLLAAHASIAHLKRLDLSNNTLTDTTGLATLCEYVCATPQRKATKVALTAKEIAGFAPDAASLAKGRELATLGHWPSFGLETKSTTYWGRCQGSELYEVFLRLPSLETGCSCPSGKRPCKHSIGLALLITKGTEFRDAAVPGGLVSRASAARYGSSWE